jgi:hypothetical protein
MEFKGRYLNALRDNDPKLFMALRRSGQLDAHVQAKGLEANELLQQMLAQEPKGPNGLPLDPQAYRLAQERAMAQMLEFPTPESEQTPEPPDDLTPSSRARTSGSSPAP